MDEAITAPPPAFDYGVLPPEKADQLQDAVAYINHRIRGVTGAMLEVGAKLLEAKADLEHGQFGAWIEAEFPFSIRTAQRYMGAAEALPGKSDTVSYLPVTTAYKLSRASDTVREKVLHEIEVAKSEDRLLDEDKVSTLLYRAKEEEAAAKAERMKSPEQQRKERAKAAREKRERAKAKQEQEARRQANVKQAIKEEEALIAAMAIIREQCADKISDRIILFETAGSSFRELRIRLQHPFGKRSGYSDAPRERPWFEEPEDQRPRFY